MAYKLFKQENSRWHHNQMESKKQWRNHFRELSQININSLLEVLENDAKQAGWLRYAPLNWAGRPVANRFAQQMLEFDAMLASNHTLREAATTMIHRYVADHETIDAHRLPVEGPVIIAANHPGLTDTLALFSSIHRDDIKIIAEAKPFLTSLPHVSDRLIYLESNRRGGAAVMKQAVRHLADSGCLVVFPAGKIEADPVIGPATTTLPSWSNSIFLMASKVAHAKILPVIISGVCWHRAYQWTHATDLPGESSQARFAAAVQLIFQMMLPGFRPTRVQVRYGHTIKMPEDGSRASMQETAIHMKKELLTLIEQNPSQ